MPLISVLTITHPAGSDFIMEAMDSVRKQQLPPEWDLEWIVQEDGPRSDLGDQLRAEFENVRYDANGSKLGIGQTRNLALARVSGALVQNLDSDDMLLPGALGTLIPAFIDHEVHWAIGQADDLLPDGSRKSFPPDLPFGRVPAGKVNGWAAQHGGNWPIHCAGLVYRTSSLRAVGGWAGVPFDDDIITFAAISQAADGHFDPTVTWLYRQHPNQAIRDPHWRQWGGLGRKIALQRAAAVKLTGMSLPATGVDPNPHIDVASPMKQTISIEN